MLIPSELQSVHDFTSGPCDADMDNGWRGHVFDTVILTRTGADIVEESFAATEGQAQSQLHFID